MSSRVSPTDTPELLAEQIDYYRARAPEYDQWWNREGRYDRAKSDWQADAAAVVQALEEFRPSGRILELACGTGIWSERLLQFASEVVAVDASPEMLALNAARLRSPRVRYVRANLFEWQPSEQADAVFFGFWLSHVPLERFEQFWELVGRCLAPGGRVFFVDSLREETSTASDHVLPDPGSPLMWRRLNDGRQFRIVKVFYEPRVLAEKLRRLGWFLEIRQTSHYFIYGYGGRASA